MHKPRQLPAVLRETPTTAASLHAALGVFALGALFGWLLAGTPDIFAMIRHAVP